MTHSEQLNDLFTALSKAQGEMAVAELNQKNPFFKSRYADLVAIVRASRPALTKYGLSVNQAVVYDVDAQAYLLTILGHSSGQYMSSKMKITPAKSDIQSFSSYVTYAKRMCYASLVGVVTGDEDDDGEATMTEYRNPSPAVIKHSNVDYITGEQLDILEQELDGHPTIAEQVISKMGLASLPMLQKKDFSAVLARVRQVKELTPKGK
jgi:hypothetical protein